MGLLRKFDPILPWLDKNTLYEIFIISQLDYIDMIYEQACNSFFLEKLDSIQYSAFLAITGAIRVPSTEKLQQELGSESLRARHWFRKLRHFCKIMESLLFIYFM